ncbi:MAG: sodium-dependent transporter [Oscillospiraceae bacterium]|nr:sodium-dependent transporter [Oscillospiraceae bacterium]
MLSRLLNSSVENWICLVASIIPAIILPYYCVIGGWILKYLASYLTGGAADMVADGYFTGFITAQWSPIIWFVIFLLATMLVVYKGVNKGIEKLSSVLMPVLVVLILGISLFSLTLSHTDAAGVTRTGLEGLTVYIIPNFDGMTLGSFLRVLTDAMGQLFFSISVAMGIMITYGSYVPKETNLVSSVNQIEIFDTVVAFLAGLMIIPAVYTFMGTEGMSSGPSLMFISLPKVFDAMGGIGLVVAIAFFVMVTFAALTSSVSIMEALVSCVMDKTHIQRKGATIGITIFALVVGIIVCLGYNLFYFDLSLPNGSVGQILDVLDYISNYLLMPIVAIATCVLVGWVIKPKTIIEEVTLGGAHFGREKLYVVMVKYITPIMLLYLLLQSLGIIA